MRCYSDGVFLIKLIKDRIKEKNKSVFQQNINLDTRDRFSQNALYWAITYKRVNDVKILLKHNINQEVAPNLDAITHAINIGDKEIISLLKKEDKEATLLSA